MALLMSSSSVLGHIEREFLFLSVKDERLFLKKKKKALEKKSLLRILQLPKISSNFLERQFYYARRPFISLISSYVPFRL